MSMCTPAHAQNLHALARPAGAYTKMFKQAMSSCPCQLAFAADPYPLSLAELTGSCAWQASVQLRDTEIARLAAEVQRCSSHIDEAVVQRRAETHETIILQLHSQVWPACMKC